MMKSHVTFGFLFAAFAASAAGVAESWVTEGFEAFRRGTFGNAGHNLYVSKAGVLQRIYQYDLDHNGWFDLTFANCQNHHESAPSYVYAPDGRRVSTLPGQGSLGGTVVDLDGDGILDLVVGGRFDMVSPFATTDIYYGSPDGEYSERYHVKIQTPWAEDCWHGRFRGEARPSLVFAMPTYGIVRLCEQTDIGFEWTKFTDLAIKADLVTAADLDGDGFDDLVTRRARETRTSVYWGGKDGLSVSNRSDFAELPKSEILLPDEAEGMQSDLEKKFEAVRLLQTVEWAGRRCFTLSTGKKVLFVAADRARRFEKVFEIEVPMVYAVTAGDFNRDGLRDLAFASQVRHPDDPAKQASFIWLNSKDGFTAANRIAVETSSACCIDSLDDKVLIGQCEANRLYTNVAQLFTVRDGRVAPDPQKFEGENMHRVFFVRNPGREDRIFLLNNYARSSVGFDRSYVYWGREGGRYDPKDRTEVPSWCAVDAVPADLDDDGWAELIIGNNSENSLNLDPGNHVHHFGPKGFEPSRSYTLPTDIGWSSLVSDFDRDGYLDVMAVADHWHSLRLFHGGPDGLGRVETIKVLTPKKPKSDEENVDDSGDREVARNRASIKIPSGGGMRWPLAVDLNMDGWLDIAIPTCADRQIILWGGEKGYSMDRRQEVIGVMCTGVRAADLDRNGYPDLIFGGHTSQPNGKDVYRRPHHSYVYVFWNGPDGIRDSRKTILRADAASHLCVGDLDGNGWLDVFASSYNGEVDRDINSFIYWNRGGNFTQFDRQDLITHAVSGCVALDFNEDGRIDLALANHKVFGDHVGNSEVWWNTDEGFLPTRTTKLPTCGPHGMYAMEPGNLMTRGPEEYYTSAPYVADRDLTVSGVKVEGEIPEKTWVKALVRVDGGAWREPAGCAVRKGQKLQYRLELGAYNSLRTPRVRKVTVGFDEGVSAAVEGKAIYVNIDFLDEMFRIWHAEKRGVTPADITNVIRNCKSVGAVGVNWRIASLGMVAHPSKLQGDIEYAVAKGQHSAEVRKRLVPREKNPIGYLREDFIDFYRATTKVTPDTLAVAVGACRAAGLKINLWIDLHDEMFGKFATEHPECLVRTPEGGTMPGVRDYGNAVAVAEKIAEIEELYSYEPDGFYFCPSCHSRHFNYAEKDGAFGTLSASKFTEFIRKARRSMLRRGFTLTVGTACGGLNFCSPHFSRHVKYRIEHDWRTWVDAGLVDALVVGDYEILHGYGEDWAPRGVTREGGREPHEVFLPEFVRTVKGRVPLYGFSTWLTAANVKNMMKRTTDDVIGYGLDGAFVHEHMTLLASPGGFDAAREMDRRFRKER